MATSFIKSFMEAVNPATARAAKKPQDPQDPRVEKTRQPQAASNALLDATSREALGGAANRSRNSCNSSDRTDRTYG